MRMKRTLALLLTASMMFTLAACNTEPKPSETPEAEAIYTAGVYTAEATGMDKLTVEVTVSDSAITGVKVLEHKETDGIGTLAIDELPDKIVEAQAATVDGVASATITSDAIKAAVQKCLDKAMGKEEPAGTAGYTAGTYDATVKAHNGEMTVEVTFDESAIKDIKIGDHVETYGLGYGLQTSPIEVLPEAILHNQSLAVDAVASATITSNAIKQAVAECVTKAGGDAEALKSAPVEAPLVGHATFDVDVVVVGAGAAGLSAAVTAKEAGLDVLVLEKTGITGGSTTRSGGKVLGAGTPTQTAQDFTDTPDMMYDFLMSYDRDGLMNPELVRVFSDNSAENIQWLVDRGVEVQDVEPIHSALTPWRVHNVKGGGGQTSGHGGQICVPLTRAFEKAAGQIVYNCRATELVTKDGVVVGVKGETADGGTVTVNAKNVILATGGFAHSDELMAAYTSFLPSNAGSGVPKTNVGDGLKMAQAIGAKSTVNPGLQLVYLNYQAYIGIAEESGLITDATGNRLVNEYTYQSHVASALARANSPVGYYITATKDGVCAEPYPMVQRGVTIPEIPQAGSIEELAGLIGVDGATLKATVDRYNEMCKNGKDTDFGKPAEHLIPVEGDTYYAFMMNDSSSVTFGGLEINTKAQVLDTQDQPIPGLYAAGEVAHTGLFSDEYPCCGMAIGAAIYFGRVAAQEVAAQ